MTVWLYDVVALLLYGSMTVWPPMTVWLNDCVALWPYDPVAV